MDGCYTTCRKKGEWFASLVPSHIKWLSLNDLQTEGEITERFNSCHASFHSNFFTDHFLELTVAVVSENHEKDLVAGDSILNNLLPLDPNH